MFLEGDTREAESLARERSVSLLRNVLEADVLGWRLPADPRQARYAVIRPEASGIEGFLIERGIFSGWARLENSDHFEFARRLLRAAEPRTTADDQDAVLRWFGTQRPPARLVLLPDDDELAAADAIESAVLALSSVGET
jgi:hypothetical protein